MTPDADLLDRFSHHADAAAFAELVGRYLPLVYASAKRRTADAALADDVSQAVFLVLAKKAATLDGRRPIGDWLLVVTRHTAMNALRQRARRSTHEREAARQQSEAAMPSAEGSPDRREEQAAWQSHLDAAMDRLPAADRQAILLRYYAAAEFSAVAAALNTTEAAARKRVTRAVEKLRSVFMKKGVAVPATALAAALPATLALTPPPALAATITTTAALGSTAAGTSAALLAKGTLKTMLLAKAKTVVAASLAVVLAAGGATGVGYVALAQSPPVSTSRPAFPAPTRPFVGWLKLEFRGRPGQTPVTSFVEPATGRQIRVSGPDAAVVESFSDPTNRTEGRLFANIGRFIVGVSNAAINTDFPVTEAAVAKEFSSEPYAGAVSFRVRPVAAGVRVTDITLDRKKLPPDTAANMPDAIELHADADTGVIRRLVALPTTDGKTAGYDSITTTASDRPPFDVSKPETLPLPAGVTLLDNRPSPEVRAVLTQLENIVDRGLGFETGVVLKRSASPTTGEFDDDLDEMTVCSGDATRFVIATWKVGGGANRDGGPGVPKPAGWPKPTLEAVLASVGDARPSRFAVFDGDTCWISNDLSGGPPDATGRQVRSDPKQIWRTYSIAGRLWGRFPLDGELTTAYALDASRKDERPVLRATVHSPYQRYGTTQPVYQPMQRFAIRLWPDLGPYPVRIEQETINPAEPNRGEPRDTVRRTITDVGLPGWMFREPVRVPEHWRTQFLDDGDPAYVQYETLVPFDKGIVPDQWFDDPAKTWPVKN